MSSQRSFEMIPIQRGLPAAPPATRRALFPYCPYLAIGLIAAIVLGVTLFRRDLDWQLVYLPAAERLSTGQDVFLDGSGFVYPPINALLALPFSELPRAPSLLLWHALNMAALAILIAGAWKLSGGGLARTGWREHAIFWLGLGCGITSCFDVVTNQQTDLIVAALVVLGCLALIAGRDLRAALWFGVAAAIKCTPLLWAGYLAWRKRWAAAFVVVIVAAGVNLIPDLAFPRQSQTRLEEWTHRFLLPMAERKHEFGAWACGVGGNQSVPGIIQRWLMYDTAWEGNDLVAVPRERQASPETLKATSGSAMLALLLGAMVFSWRRRGGISSVAPLPPTAALEFGLVVILMVLLSPHSSKPHYCTLLLPGFCVARAAIEARSRRLMIVLAAALLLALSTSEDLVGEWFYSWSKWHGALTGSALLLYAASGTILLKRRRANAALNGAAAPSIPLAKAA